MMENTTKPYRILIVDDSPEDREMYRRLIARGREQDYLFWETESGEHGLQLYRSEQPDCVVLDYNLPDLSGLEILARLQAEHGGEPVPVIMLTGQGSERVAVQALKLGAQDYFIKNRSAEGLKFAVHSVIEKAALWRQIKEQRSESEEAARALRESEERYRLLGTRLLRESEERYRLLVESVMNYSIVMLDHEGHIISWNAGTECLLGYRAEEIIGKHFSCLYTPEGVERSLPQHQLEIAAGKGRCADEAWRLRKDGSRFLAHVTITALRDESHTLRGFANVTRRISETGE
jgi:PAS domain S-box-containing protein